MKTEKLWALYLIRTACNRLYTGVTTDMARRLRQHQSGKGGAKWLRNKGPLSLVYQSEYFLCRSCALRLEKRVKRQSRLVKEKMVRCRPGRSELVAFMLSATRSTPPQ